MKTTHIPAMVLLLGAFCGFAHAAERDFQAVVGALEDRLGVHHTHIPMIGLAKMFVKVSAPSGVHRFELATFDDLRYSTDMTREFHIIVSDALGEAWHSMVQVQAPWRKEYTGIFIKTQGDRFVLMIATIEAQEATVVEVQLSPSQWFEWLRSPSKMGHRAEWGNRHEQCCEEE